MKKWISNEEYRKKQLKKKNEKEKRIAQSIEAWRKKQDQAGFVSRDVIAHVPKFEIRKSKQKSAKPISKLDQMASDGYVVLPGKKLEHRVVCEQHYGPIPKYWEVHHINEIKNDNRPENLIALPIYFHRKIHNEGNPKHYTREYLSVRLSTEIHLYQAVMTRRGEIKKEISMLIEESKRLLDVLKG